MSSTASSPAASASKAYLKFITNRGEIEYPKQVWYILLSCLAAATLVNITTILWGWHRLHRHKNAHPSPPSSIDGSSAPRKRGWISRLCDAGIATSRIVFFRWEIPLWRGFCINVLEGFIIASYTAILLIFEFAHTDNLTVSAWSNRAAHLLAAQIPLLPALSAKNNIIGWLTGLGHEKMNVLHRMFSRSLFLMMLIHFWGRWKAGLHAKSGDSLPQEPWERLGAAAGFLFATILVLGSRPVRTRSYETFYWLHVALVSTFLVVVYLHCLEPGFGYYIWPIWVVWAFERSMRGLRYLINNFLLRPRSPTTLAPHPDDPEKHGSPSPSSTDVVPTNTKSAVPERHLAIVTLLSHRCFRITLPKTRMLWTPGQHAFLAFPSVSLVPLESHPFTIANIPSASPRSSILNLLNLNLNLPMLRRKAKDGGERPEFVVRVRDGMTRRLREQVERYGVPVLGEQKEGVERVLKVPVFIDGPYGVAPTLAPYENVVLIAGGTGVSFTLSLLLSAIQSVSTGDSLTKRLLFIWATRELSEIDHISTAIQTAIAQAPASLPSTLSLDIAIYHTHAPEGGEPNSDASSASGISEGAATRSSTSIQVINARPDVRACIGEEISRAQGGAMLVAVCGPHSLTSAVRKTLSFSGSGAGPRGVMKGGPTVTLHVEHFSM